jgi:hypothetical protein
MMSLGIISQQRERRRVCRVCHEEVGVFSDFELRCTLNHKQEAGVHSNRGEAYVIHKYFGSCKNDRS